MMNLNRVIKPIEDLGLVVWLELDSGVRRILKFPWNFEPIQPFSTTYELVL